MSNLNPNQPSVSNTNQPSAPPQSGEDNSATQPKDRRFFWLSVGQYVLLGVVGVLFAYFLVYGVVGSDGKNMERLADPEVARGVITYLVAVATVAIATMLVMAAIMSGGKDLDRRFALGKEVLTLLIGVLGTIIGFYYGSTTKAGTSTTGATTELQVATVKITPEPIQIGKPFNLSTLITGGTPPYTFSIKFDPNVITPPVENQTSNEGRVNRDFNIPETAKVETPINFVIEVKDKNNKAFTYNKDGQQKITLKGP